MDTISI